MQRGQLLIGPECVLHPPVQQPLRQGLVPVSGHNCGLRSQLRGLVQKGMSVKAFTAQGDEERTRLQLATVSADRPELDLQLS